MPIVIQNTHIIRFFFTPISLKAAPIAIGVPEFFKPSEQKIIQILYSTF